MPIAPVLWIQALTESTKLLLPAAFLIVSNSVQLKFGLYSISHSPRYSIVLLGLIHLKIICSCNYYILLRIGCIYINYYDSTTKVVNFENDTGEKFIVDETETSISIQSTRLVCWTSTLPTFWNAIRTAEKKKYGSSGIWSDRISKWALIKTIKTPD